MIKEELKQEAEESFEQYKVTDEDYVVSPYSDDMGEKMLMYNYEYYAEETYLRLYTQGYLASAEPREKRIAELEQEKCELLGIIQGKDKAIKDLEWQLQEVAKDNDNYQKENAELKKEWQEQVQKATDEGYARTLQTMQLSKAKELLKKIVGTFYYLCEINNFSANYECLAEAEQFLNSEVEK